MAEKKPGWYNVPGKGERYWTGSEYRFTGPGQGGDGRDVFNFTGWVGDKFARSQQPLSAERQARSEAQKRFNNGTATEADRKLLRKGKPSGGDKSQPEKNIIYVTGADGKEIALDMNNPADVKRIPAGKVNPNNYVPKKPAPKQEPPASKQEPSVTGRETERVNPQGVVQKGTDMSGANALLARLGIDTVQYGQFESNKLPGDQQVEGKPQKTGTEAVLVNNQPKNYGDYNDLPKNLDESPTKETSLVTSGVQSASDRLQLGTRARASHEFLADRPNMRAQDNESLVGLRASEASKGLLYASGKYWREDGNGGFTEISKADFKSIKRGDQHAQQFAADKIAETKAQAGIGQQPTLVEAQADAKEYDYGSDAGYGGYDTYQGAPDAADYPEPQAVAPADTDKDESATRIDWLNYKKDQGDFKQYIQEDDWAK